MSANKLREFKDVAVGETFRFINSYTDYVKVGPRRYKHVEDDTAHLTAIGVGVSILRVGTIHAKVEE